MPRILYWITGILGLIQILVLLLILIPVDWNKPKTTRFNKAYRCTEKPSQVQLNTPGITALINQPVQLQNNCWHPVTLPDQELAQDVNVDQDNPGLQRIWYRVDYLIPVNWPEDNAMMVYIPRIVGHAWQIRIDGKAIKDNRLEWRNTWIRPAAAIFYPGKRLTNKPLQVEIGVIASEADGFSIARITVGDAAVIIKNKAMREYFQLILPQAMSAVILMLGIFYFSFWIARREESEFLLLAIACLILSIIHLKFAFTQPDDPIKNLWFFALVYEIPNAWTIWLLFLSVSRFAKVTLGWLEWLLWSYLMVYNLSVLTDLFSGHDFGIIRGIVNNLIGILFLGAISWQAFYSKTVGIRPIVISIILGIFGGIYDTLLMLNILNPELIIVSPFFTLLILAVWIPAIQRRYITAIETQDRLNIDLEQRLAEREALTKQLTEKEKTLRAQQNRLLELERIQTLTDERQRLMHDMHDGVGSSLLSTLAAVENNKLSQEAVGEALRECLEDLRLVIDSLEPVEHDLVTLLATIRYRLGQRLDAAGIKLNWEINDLPPLPWLEPSDALNVLRLVQEALVNILKHAHADHINVATMNHGRQVEIRIDDNGQGFDLNAIIPGRGLRGQRKRAELLGGELTITSAYNQGTSLRLLLPIEKNKT